VPRTNADYLRWKLGQWAREYAPNIRMLADGSSIPVRLEFDESAVAEISLASGGSPIVVTDIRLVRDGQTILRYDELKHCIWIDRDRETKVKRKTSHFHRMILELNDGSEFVLEGLGQAVFPLLKFFWFKLGRDESAAG
jgi:hypothetical protein